MRLLETRRIPVLLALATLLPMAALCWLALRTLAQDRELERQRQAERLKVAAERVALDIERDLQRVEARLVQGHGIRLRPGGLTATDDEPILFQPEVASALGPVIPELLAAAQLQYRQQSPAAAIAAYRRLARSGLPAVKGEALVALGGLLRREHNLEAALRSYHDLATLGTQRVAGGQPAALVALQGRGRALEEAGDRERLAETARALAASLGAGGWDIDAVTFDLYREMVGAWGGPAIDAESVHRTDAAAALWRAWRRGELPARGRRFIEVEDSAVLATWVSDSDGPVLAVASPAQLQARWRPLWETRGLTVAVSLIDGRPLFGSLGGTAATLFPADTRPPLMLAVVGEPSQSSGTALRSRAVIGGILFIGLMMGAASYGLHRIIRRELSLARQQSDFVAAVSHEFRTPLTSMRHLLDLLATRAVTGEERRTHYYALLAGETERLQRMVETLLSFGRLDAAAHAWRFERVDVRSWLVSIGDEFRRHHGDRPLVCECDDDLPDVHADREALSRALWNLLENAAKYSSARSPVRIRATTAREEGRRPHRNVTTVLIAVEDQGMGIPASEQRRIFEKFVRGAEAKRAGIRGVGVGLALVTRILEAHGGRIAVESVVGRGSTFTMALPACERGEAAESGRALAAREGHAGAGGSMEPAG